VSGDGGDDGVDVGEGFFGGGGVGDFEAVVFFEGDDELKGVHGVEAKSAGAEEGEVVRDFFGLLLQHQIFNEQFFYVGFELVNVVHAVDSIRP
jgi:hypothetical protein